VLSAKTKTSKKKRTTNRDWSRGSKWISPTLRLAIYIRDRFECQCCGRDLRSAHPVLNGGTEDGRWTIQLDHLWCHEKGGKDEPGNLVTICIWCNSKRQNKPWTKFYPPGALARVRAAVRRKVNVKLARALMSGKAGRKSK
jgi:5-methylcytosine-specific restriction endonuclease McrA